MFEVGLERSVALGANADGCSMRMGTMEILEYTRSPEALRTAGEKSRDYRRSDGVSDPPGGHCEIIEMGGDGLVGRNEFEERFRPGKGTAFGRHHRENGHLTSLNDGNVRLNNRRYCSLAEECNCDSPGHLTSSECWPSSRRGKAAVGDSFCEKTSHSSARIMNGSDCGDFAFPTETLTKFSHRFGWLALLLVLQSLSSVILKHFQPLVLHHPVVILFLTMLVGAGGNAGSQSAVLAIRAIAKGSFAPHRSMRDFIFQELRTGFLLASLLAVLAFGRVFLVKDDLVEVLAITSAMFVIVLCAVGIGTLMPLLLWQCGLDPAHAGAAIQVTVDIFGVAATCIISTLIYALFLPVIRSDFATFSAATPPLTAIPLAASLGGLSEFALASSTILPYESEKIWSVIG